jgi:hypothetical protein
MTSLLPRSTTTTGGPGGSLADLRHRRPLGLVSGLGGALAAGATLLVCLAVGVVGWFLSDAGAHGTPRDGLRVGALGWLLAHGSGTRVEGVPVSAVPLGITLLCAWAAWRVAHQVGDMVSGHGPDADRIADGERDWTVASASLLFAAGYSVVGLTTAALATEPGTGVSRTSVLGWSLLLCLFFAVPAIAVGSGRAAIWAAYLPPVVRGSAVACVRVLRSYLLASLLVLLVALALDLGSAVNVMSELHASGGEAALLVLLTLTLVPNATVFSGSYLLGPGFAVGTHTLVSPGLVVLGPLPMFPLLAALPDDGPTPAWTTALLAVPVLVAALATARAQRRLPTLRWDEGALRGCAGGVAAGLLLGLLAGVSGGAVGPGRMRDVGPLAFDVLVHAVTAFGIGGLLGGLVMTWWQRRTARRGAETD